MQGGDQGAQVCPPGANCRQRGNVVDADRDDDRIGGTRIDRRNQLSQHLGRSRSAAAMRLPLDRNIQRIGKRACRASDQGTLECPGTHTGDDRVANREQPQRPTRTHPTGRITQRPRETRPRSAQAQALHGNEG